MASENPRHLIRAIRRNPILFWTGVAHLGLLILFTAFAFTDGRQLLGVNLWVKPMKFALSIGIYAFTLAWLLELLGDEGWKRRISPWIAGLLALEMIAIGGQAARGVQSHFNVSTPFDGAVYSLMGLSIAVSTTLVLITGIKFLRRPRGAGASEALWLAAGLGLLFSALFSFEGFAMGARLAHTVGAPDGGSGWPLLNWSHAHGDLRVAHFIGIHSLQVMPLLGAWVSRRAPQNGRLWTWGLCLGYALLAATAFFWAMAGRGI